MPSFCVCSVLCEPGIGQGRIRDFEQSGYAFCMVFHVIWIFLTTSLRIPPSHLRRGWFSETSGENSISHGKSYQMHFFAYFTLHCAKLKNMKLRKIEDHENHVRWIYPMIISPEAATQVYSKISTISNCILLAVYFSNVWNLQKCSTRMVQDCDMDSALLSDLCLGVFSDLKPRSVLNHGVLSVCLLQMNTIKINIAVLGVHVAVALHYICVLKN